MSKKKTHNDNDLEVFLSNNKTIVSNNLKKIQNSEILNEEDIIKLEKVGFFENFRGKQLSDEILLDNDFNEENKSKIKSLFLMLSEDKKEISAYTLRKFYIQENTNEEIKPINLEKFNKIIYRAYKSIDSSDLSFENYLELIEREMIVNLKREIFDSELSGILMNSNPDKELRVLFKFKFSSVDKSILNNNKQEIIEKIFDHSNLNQIDINQSINIVKQAIIQQKTNYINNYLEKYPEIKICDTTSFPMVIGKILCKDLIKINSKNIFSIHLFNQKINQQLNLTKLIFNQNTIGIKTIPDKFPLLSVNSEALYALNLVKPNLKIDLNLFNQITTKNNNTISNNYNSFSTFILSSDENKNKEFIVFVPKDCYFIDIGLSWSNVLFESNLTNNFPIFDIEIEHLEKSVKKRDVNYINFRIKVAKDNTHYPLKIIPPKLIKETFFNFGIAWFTTEKLINLDLEQKIAIINNGTPIPEIISEVAKSSINTLSEESTEEETSEDICYDNSKKSSIKTDSTPTIESTQSINESKDKSCESKDKSCESKDKSSELKDKSCESKDKSCESKDKSCESKDKSNDDNIIKKENVKESIAFIKNSCIPLDIFSDDEMNEVSQAINSINKNINIDNNNNNNSTFDQVNERINNLETKLSHLSRKNSNEMSEIVNSIKFCIQTMDNFNNSKSSIEKKIDAIDAIDVRLNQLLNFSTNENENKNDTQKHEIEKLNKDFQKHKECVINSFQSIEKKISNLYESIVLLNRNFNTLKKKKN